MITHPGAGSAPLAAAVRNNAEWCAAVSATHGTPGVFRPRAWTSRRRTPPYYPDAVTLDPGARAEDLVPFVDVTAPWASVKDSHARLDLTADGFAELFDATWLHRASSEVAAPSRGAWRATPVTDAADLAAWQLAWEGEPVDVFRPALLGHPGVRVLRVVDAAGESRGGAVLNRAAGVTGLSNLHAHEEGAEPEVLTAVLAAAARLFPGSALVGYESGEALTTARAAGFAPLGELRVWLHHPARD